MTSKKTKRFAPYTINMAVSGLSGFADPLDKVLPSYFQNKDTWPEISRHVHEAVGTCGLEMQANQLRKVTSEQRIDRYELIACIKELRHRNDPLHIPLPMLNTARVAYRPRKDSKSTLDEEIRDLLLRLHHIQRLFESNDIPTPKETNPGAPERKRLEKKLADIFDAFTKNLNAKKAVRTDNRLNFVQDVLFAFRLRKETNVEG